MGTKAKPLDFDFAVVVDVLSGNFSKMQMGYGVSVVVSGRHRVYTPQ